MATAHPDDSVLIDYAAGSLDEATALLVATHLALCPECRHRVAEAEAVGGALLAAVPGEALAPGGLEALLARLDEPAPPPPPARDFDDETHRLIPEPLRGYLPGSLRSLNWRRIGAGVTQAMVLPPRGRQRAHLLRLPAGRATPWHTHRGTEFTLVLDGGFTDATGSYRRGDVVLADGGLHHRPVADPDGDCLCFAVVDGGLRLTGPLGRLLNPFLST